MSFRIYQSCAFGIPMNALCYLIIISFSLLTNYSSYVQGVSRK